MIDVSTIRDDFPILHRTVHGKPLVYLDNAATTQKPRRVIDAITDFYTALNGNVHRGGHFLSERASNAYETARERVADFLNAHHAGEIVFTRGTTDALNLVAGTFGRKYVRSGDEIVITEMEHHSNIIPWQVLCRERGARLRVLTIDDTGVVDPGLLDDMLTDKTRLLSLAYVSNVLGSVNPVRECIEKAHDHDVPVLVDAAQAVQHIRIDVRDLGCDFLAFSGHKMYAGTGVGVLYGGEKWLDELPPYQTGGGMVADVSFERTVYDAAPFKFEAGTGNPAAVIGLGAAIEYITGIGMDTIAGHESAVMRHAAERLGAIESIDIFGNPPIRVGALSFNIPSVSPYDAGMILDKAGIAVRTGKHCADPLMKRLGVDGTIRASIGMYNTTEEIDALADALEWARRMLTT